MSRPKKFVRRPAIVKPVENRHRKDVVSRILGAKDINFSDYKYWASVINKVTEAANLYGFNRAETPIVENLSLFKKSPRLKDIYYYQLGKTDKIALRPDLTHGLGRFYLEQDLSVWPQPVKVFAIGPVFRHEARVQTGCYRQFNQFVLELFGESKPVEEALLIDIIYSIFRELQINVQIQINSVGSFECQKEFLNKFAKFYKDRAKKAKLCPECKKNLLKNPILLLACEVPSCVELRKEAPPITNFLSDESNNYFTRVLEYLDELNINYNFNPYLIKGLNYYTETIFEVRPVNEQGELDGKLSLGRGGRYNHFVEQLGGKPTPLLGFAGGLERTVAKIKEKNLIFKKEENIIFLAQVSDQARIRSMALFGELYKLGFCVRQAFSVDNLRYQLEEAKRLNAKIILILGKKEISSETILYRDVELGVQEVITQKDLRERLQKRFNQKQ
ncbi:histidine--tRNA ligase [Candidatus Falkowbacteria bacterium CG10_big_fil_rev_8_21_14_0_10_39_9]|uniref:Histidine--tRNA ligase n=1 Tax=Candidatus Falkowbacteria bacterium CG10_big_fil_rev_8_21_14_0_10_39_9 TaxID=1974566 RepID=A0A2M6WPH2_9BACT|nr:MAG: histidine--tRNA ligase [Candidatus Falkowbacteria bacterium CG10_big_fil_rev_8_21_14_0_10_39_9]